MILKKRVNIFLYVREFKIPELKHAINLIISTPRKLKEIIYSKIDIIPKK